MWGTFLSEPLDIVALVCRYHSNQLMSREPIRVRRIFQPTPMRTLMLWEISRRFRRLCPGHGQVAHVLRTLPPVAARVLLPRAAPRLACVKPAASVHPEPGSNSSLYIHTSKLSPRLPRFLQRNQRSRFYCIFLSVLACTCLSILSMNLSHTSRKGIAKVRGFFISAKYFWIFFVFILPIFAPN